MDLHTVAKRDIQLEYILEEGRYRSYNVLVFSKAHHSAAE